MCSTTNTLVAGRLPQCALPQTLKWLGDCHSVLYHHTKDGHLPTIVAGLVAGIAAGHIAGLLLQAYDAGLLLQAYCCRPMMQAFCCRPIVAGL
jgi:hypothetical protein